MNLDVKVLTKINHSLFGLRQQINKVECMYLVFKNFKILSKKWQQWSES